MLPTELYAAKDGSLFKIIRLLRTPFFRYEMLSQNEIENLKHILCKDNVEGKSKAGSFTQEPAEDGRVRTDTSIQGGDYLQRSTVYLHNHITKVEHDIGELKKLLLQRHAHSAAYDVRRDGHSESYDVQMAEVN